MKEIENKIKELEIVVKDTTNKIKELEIVVKDSTRQLEILKECLKIINPLQCPAFFKSDYDLEKWLNKNGIEFKGRYIFNNGDWAYKDKQEFLHLYRDGVELTKGVKATYVWSNNNGNWRYTDEAGNRHKFDKNNNKIN